MTLEQDFQYYKDHQAEFVEKYDGKFIVLKNQAVIGVYENEIQAYEETKKAEKLGTFLIQHVSAGEEGYTQTFYSRVAPV